MTQVDPPQPWEQVDLLSFVSAAAAAPPAQPNPEPEPELQREAEPQPEPRAEAAAAPHLRLGQRALADELTAFVHGAEAAVAAQLAGRALFGQAELEELDAATLEQALLEAGLADIHMIDGQLPSAADLFVAAGVTPSKGAARRAVEEGGAYINNAKVTEADAPLPADSLLHGRFIVLRRGKKTVAGVRLQP